MRSLLNLTRANIKSFRRDRAALFWTLAFPLVFIVLFGTIFSGERDINYKVGWVDQDRTAASGALRAAFAKVAAFTLLDEPLTERRKLLESLGLEHPYLLARLEEATDPEHLDRIFAETRGRGNEGLMVKDPLSPYTPGRRGLAFVHPVRAGREEFLFAHMAVLEIFERHLPE